MEVEGQWTTQWTGGCTADERFQQIFGKWKADDIYREMKVAEKSKIQNLRRKDYSWARNLFSVEPSKLRAKGYWRIWIWSANTEIKIWLRIAGQACCSSPLAHSLSSGATGIQSLTTQRVKLKNLNEPFQENLELQWEVWCPRVNPRASPPGFGREPWCNGWLCTHHPRERQVFSFSCASNHQPAFHQVNKIR